MTKSRPLCVTRVCLWNSCLSPWYGKPLTWLELPEPKTGSSIRQTYTLVALLDQLVAVVHEAWRLKSSAAEIAGKLRLQHAQKWR
jgi:hypothetical protein